MEDATLSGQSWANGMQKYFWATNAAVGKHYFKWFNQLSSDNDKGCAYYGSTEAKSGDCAVLSSGKISLVGSANPRLSFNYYFVNNGTHKIAVSIKTAHGIDETIKTIDYEKVKEAGAEEGWQNVMPLMPILPPSVISFAACRNGTGCHRMKDG